MPSSPASNVMKQLRAAGLGDGELLGCFVKCQDEAALATLIKRHGPMVWGVCRRLLSHHDAEDAFQATFLVLVRKAATILPRDMIGNWLYGVARQTALQARRSAARRRAREVQVTAMPQTETIQQDQWPEVQRLLDQELSHLPDNYRAVIVLCDLEGRTRKEAALQLRLPEGTVAGRLARARAMLGKRLALRGVTLSSAALAAILAPRASGGVPDAVVSTAIRAASFVAAGKAAMGPVSAKAAALAEGVLKAMLMSKLKITFVLALLAGLLLSGGGAIVWQTSAQADQRMPPAGGPTHATPANEQLTRTLVALDKQLWDAAGAGDWKVYDRLLANDFVGRSTVSGESDKRATLENVKNQRYADWTIRNAEAQEISKDVAILRYVYSCQVISQIDGSARKYRDRHTTLVWARRDGAWLLVFCQEDSGAKTALSEQPPAAAKQKPRQDKEPFTAWGKEIGGIQAGLGFRPGGKRVYHHGETATLVLRVRNIGKQEVQFQYLRHFFIENPPAVVDGKGKSVPFKDGAPRGIYKPLDVSLAPGKETELYELHIGLSDSNGIGVPSDSTLHGTGKFSVQYQRVLGNSFLSSVAIKFDPALSKLATGKLELEIKPSQEEKTIFEGSKAGDRKELVPGIAFRWCPPGKFRMGVGDDTVDIELSKGFWLGETEVTQGQWKKLMGTSPWSGRTGVGARASTDNTPPKEGSDFAASYISYDDALAFCKKLTAQEQDAGRLPKNWKYSLPTEAQWEYACRAGTKTKFSFGDDESQLSQYAWFTDNVDKVKEPYAHQVGLKKPNAWGLCDMHGNVWEWCTDRYASKRSGGKDPVGPSTPRSAGGPPVPVGPIPPPPDGSSGRNRVVRGGSWIDPPAGCSSANRFYSNPRLGNSVQGFRIAAVPSQAQKDAPRVLPDNDPAKPKKDSDKLPDGSVRGRLVKGESELDAKPPAPANEFPAAWGGGGGNDYQISLDKTVRHGGKASGSIKSITATPQWYGALTQAINADKFRGRRLRITAYVKSKDVKNSAGLWIRMEAHDGKGHYSISSDLLGDRSIKGTNDWKQHEVVIDVPKEGTAIIYFGALLVGKGQIWVDDFQFEIVGNDVKTTAKVGETGKATAEPAQGLQTVPRNLGFEE